MHINLSEFDQAITDAEKAISIKPEYAKAYLRKNIKKHLIVILKQ